MGLTFYHTKFGGSAAMSPTAESSITLAENFDLWDSGAQNLIIISKLAQYELTLKISTQFVYNFLWYPVHKPINRSIKANQQRPPTDGIFITKAHCNP